MGGHEPSLGQQLSDHETSLGQLPPLTETSEDISVGGGGGASDGGHMTSTPPDSQSVPSQYSHESPSASGHCVLPLLALMSHPLFVV